MSTQQAQETPIEGGNDTSQDTGASGAGVDGSGVDTSTDSGAEGGEAIEPAEGTIDWNGEVESLQSADWFKSDAIPEEVRGAILKGIQEKISNYNRRTTDAWTKAAEERKKFEQEQEKYQGEWANKLQDLEDRRNAFLQAVENEGQHEALTAEFKKIQAELQAKNERTSELETKLEAANKRYSIMEDEIRGGVNDLIERLKKEKMEVTQQLAERNEVLQQIEQQRLEAEHQKNYEYAVNQVQKWLPHADKIQEADMDTLIYEGNQFMELYYRRNGVDPDRFDPSNPEHMKVNKGALEFTEQRLKRLYPEPENPNPAPTGAPAADELANGGKGSVSVEQTETKADAVRAGRNPYERHIKSSVFG
jgi:hypothetical protein